MKELTLSSSNTKKFKWTNQSKFSDWIKYNLYNTTLMNM